MDHRPPSLQHDNNICPYCFTALDIRLCKNGPNKKKNYLLCSREDLHRKGKPYWHFWTLEESRMYQNGQLQPPPNRHVSSASYDFPASLSATLPSTSRSILAPQDLASASYNFPASLSATLPSTSRSVLAPQDLASSKKTTCCQRGCSSTRVAIACKSQLCKEHCIVLNKGSCPVKKHHPTSMSQRQRRKANVSRPFPARSPTPDPHWTPSFQGMLQDVAAGAAFAWEEAPALQHMQMEQPARDLDRALQSSGFDLPSPLARDSPDADEREAMELRHAIALSLASTSTPSTSTPSPAASSGSLSSSSAVFPSSSSSAPRRRVQASSVVQRTTLPAKPRITTQLNPAWMAQAGGARPTNDTFNLPQRSERRAAVDLATIQRFTLVFWNDDDKDPLILGVTECPSWPNFRLSEAPKTLALLGTDFLAIQYYDVPFRLWKRVDLDYPHILTPNTYLLMRRIGVSGRDQQRLVDQFVNSPGPQHIRYHLPAERDAVRVKLKARRKDPIPDDDSEVEVVETDTAAKKGGDGDDDDDADIVVLERPLLRITTTGTITHPIHLDHHPSPSSSSSSHRSESFSRCATPSTAPTTPLLSSAPPPSFPDASNKWPKGMFTLDMADGFMRMEHPDLQHLPVAARFRKVFKTDRPYVPRTYADARLRWSRGSEALRTEAYDAGRTSEGLWSAYAAQVPLKK
ncbi:hypothetical protein DFH06DRAFT_1331103 [Mycena polygramma]|nr:hypothetical protein DFH06DRAFT_1331103 [Mycena polygramma]